MTSIDFDALIAEEQRCRPRPVSDGIYADFAVTLVEAHNAEGRDLNASSFVRATARCTLQQRYAIALELPPWAQQRLNETAGGQDAA